MKKIFTLLLVGFGLVSSQAQPRVHLGLTTAYNATFVLDQGLQDDPRYNAQATYNFAPIGFTAGLDLTGGFGLQLESIFSRQGQIYEIVDAAKQKIGERKIELNYLQLPLLLRAFSSASTRARFNFMLGPQLSILTQGVEAYEYESGRVNIPPGTQPPPGSTQNADGTYQVPAQPYTEVGGTSTGATYQKFRETDLQLVLGIGVDVDLARNIYVSTQIRGNYGFLDMRNGDLIDSIKNGATRDLFGERANALVGIQIGLHYMFGGVPSFSSR